MEEKLKELTSKRDLLVAERNKAIQMINQLQVKLGDINVQLIKLEGQIELLNELRIEKKKEKDDDKRDN